MKSLAREVREEFDLETPRVLRTHLRCIYRKHQIRIDLWPAREGQPCKFRKLRGAYFNDESGPTVMINRQLPQDPRVFTMAHELKHHLVDRDLVVSYCGQDNDNARRVANYCGCGTNEFTRKVIYWFEYHGQQYVDSGFSGNVLRQAIEDNQALKVIFEKNNG